MFGIRSVDLSLSEKKSKQPIDVVCGHEHDATLRRDDTIECVQQAAEREQSLRGCCCMQNEYTNTYSKNIDRRQAIADSTRVRVNVRNVLTSTIGCSDPRGIRSRKVLCTGGDSSSSGQRGVRRGRAGGAGRVDVLEEDERLDGRGDE